MKAIRNITIIFTVFMLAALAAFAVVWLKARMSVEITASFSMDDLEAYKNVLEPIKDGFNRGRQELFAAVLVFWGIVLVSGYILIGLVYNLNIKPVEEMEEYASEIAKGNLDVKLPMRRHNIFGGFTESFDMMRDELKTSRKREVEAQKAKRDMVAELSHDLKTPVATIAATCEVLDMKYQIRKKEGSEKEIKDAEDTLEKIGYIKEKSDVITRLVENVFSATEGEVDEIKVDPQETQSSVIEGFFESYREYANIIFKNHIPQCLVYLDKLRMEQVIDNVIGNSIKYAGTDITVSFDV
ncbi:MAG: HAMP domain-containing histidine kinase, partial [Clostridiales bacterium]|nr:HAMP domain-containing histidine kinase [Clostridiales bacterium]